MSPAPVESIGLGNPYNMPTYFDSPLSSLTCSEPPSSCTNLASIPRILALRFARNLACSASAIHEPTATNAWAHLSRSSRKTESISCYNSRVLRDLHQIGGGAGSFVTLAGLERPSVSYCLQCISVDGNMLILTSNPPSQMSNLSMYERDRVKKNPANIC